MARYFAYGMNMDLDAVRRRCSTPEMLGIARLDGFRFVINSRGVATVARDQAGCVHGVLWELCDDDLAALDEFEGVAAGHYRREAADVLRPTGEGEWSIIYVASDAVPGPPRPGYLEAVIAAATTHGFPSGYLAELRGWAHNR